MAGRCRGAQGEAVTQNGVADRMRLQSPAIDGRERGSVVWP